MNRFKFITLEGPDCSGKTYVYNKLIENEYFQNGDFDFISMPSKACREKLKFNIDADFNKMIIDDHLDMACAIKNSPCNIISDRSILSISYQIILGNMDFDKAVAICRECAIPTDMLLMSPGYDIVLNRISNKKKDDIEMKLNKKIICELYDMYSMLAIKLGCKIHVVTSVENNYEQALNIIKSI